MVYKLVFALNQLVVALSKRHPRSSFPSVPLHIAINDVEIMDEIHQSFFTYMRQIVTSTGEAKTSSKGTVLAESVDKIIAIQYADSNLCIESIADTMGLSPSYLGRLYKQNTGISITEQLQAKRMERAEALLIETDDTISCISQEVGFGSDTYFYKMFKQKNGVTPLDYRKNKVKS